MQLARKQTPRVVLARREAPASLYIPYSSHYDAQTIQTRNGQLLQVLKIDGLSFRTADSDTLDMRKHLRNALFKSIASHNYALYIHTVRRRQPAFPEGVFTPGFAADLNDQWRHKHESRSLYANDLYITVVRRGQGGRVGRVQHWIERLSHAASKEREQEYLRDAAKDLRDTITRFTTNLDPYGVEVLGIKKTDAGHVSEPLRFLSRLINLDDRPVLVPRQDLRTYLPYKRHIFGPRALEVRGPSSSRYAAMISIKEYGPETSSGLLDEFLTLPYEFVVTQSFAFMNRRDALDKLQTQQRLLASTEDVSESQIAAISQALDETNSGDIAFGYHHLTVMPVCDDVQTLEKAVASIDSKLTDIGIIAVREDLNLEPCFWAQLPTNFSYIARKAPISTRNLAGFASLHNFPSGRIDGNHWGPAVAVLETTSSTPYFFNYHVADVGHTLIIGPTGAGKTVLMNFLTAQARKFNCKLFAFDKDRGAEIFVRAIGGDYAILGGGRPSGFNPLLLPDNPSNRAFLADWLSALLSTQGETITSGDMAMVNEAIRGNYKLPPEARTLSNIAPFLGMGGPGSLAGRIAQWYGQGSRANLFGGVHDTLSFDQHVFGFEMGPLLADPQSLAPTLLYLFHRIQMVLDGAPTMINLDEGWALLDNPVFAPKIKDWLKTIRKLNGFVVFSTQSPEDAAKSSISDTLVQSAATQIYLPNHKATDTYKNVFKLTEREFNLIRETDPASRCFLLKHGRDSVVARLDLGGMPEVIAVLSGRAETVKILDRIRAEHGDDPKVWLPRFAKEAV